MPLTGEYELSPASWVRDQTEKIFETGTTDSVDIKGRPVVLVTMRGAKSGKLRKVPLMRVEHDGVYAAVASIGGAPEHPSWYFNVLANPGLELRDTTMVTPSPADPKSVHWSCLPTTLRASRRSTSRMPSPTAWSTNTSRSLATPTTEPGVRGAALRTTVPSDAGSLPGSAEAVARA